MRTPIAAGLVAASLLLVSCGSSDSSTPDTTATTTVVAGDTTTTAAGTAAGRVDANTATNEELVAALTAAEVSNADRWAREVQEYRPYSGTDDWAKLKQELAKYNIDTPTLTKILSALEVN